MTSSLPVILIDEPGPFEPLEIWEMFLAEVEAMPDFQLKDIIVHSAKLTIKDIKKDLGARRQLTQSDR